MIDALVDGPLRYGDLAERVGAASNVVADRLRRLEADGLVVSSPYSERPVRFSYELTAGGRELADALIPLAAWGAAAEGQAAARFHAPCGTGIELRPWCPTCDRPVTGEAPSTYDL
jgi:DNA-binding HxlR family transcriptional regulator